MLNKNVIFRIEVREACLRRTEWFSRFPLGVDFSCHFELGDSLGMGPSERSWEGRDLGRGDKNESLQFSAGRQGGPTQWLICHQAECPQRVGALTLPAAFTPRLPSANGVLVGAIFQHVGPLKSNRIL